MNNRVEQKPAIRMQNTFRLTQADWHLFNRLAQNPGELYTTMSDSELSDFVVETGALLTAAEERVNLSAVWILKGQMIIAWAEQARRQKNKYRE